MRRSAQIAWYPERFWVSRLLSQSLKDGLYPSSRQLTASKFRTNYLTAFTWELQGLGPAYPLEGKSALAAGGSRKLGIGMATTFLLIRCSQVNITPRKLDGEQGIDRAVEKFEHLSIAYMRLASDLL